MHPSLMHLYPVFLEIVWCDLLACTYTGCRFNIPTGFEVNTPDFDKSLSRCLAYTLRKFKRSVSSTTKDPSISLRSSQKIKNRHPPRRFRPQRHYFVFGDAQISVGSVFITDVLQLWQLRFLQRVRIINVLLLDRSVWVYFGASPILRRNVGKNFGKFSLCQTTRMILELFPSANYQLPV